MIIVTELTLDSQQDDTMGAYVSLWRICMCIRIIYLITFSLPRQLVLSILIIALSLSLSLSLARSLSLSLSLARSYPFSHIHSYPYPHEFTYVHLHASSFSLSRSLPLGCNRATLTTINLSKQIAF